MQHAPAFAEVTVEQALRLRPPREALTLWCLPLDLPVGVDAPDLAALSATERQSAARLRLPAATTRALRARAWLRALLGAALGQAPADLRFDTATHGKPRLQAPHADLRYSVSHTQGWMLLALSREVEPGADLELTRARNSALTLARRYFTPLESAQLGALPDAERAAAFLRLWTCKEAVLKAMGRGIAFGLSRLEVDLAGASGAKLGCIAAEAGPAQAWQLFELAPGPGLLGAVAWRGPVQPMQAFRVKDVAVGGVNRLR